jgi:hypothetical protein
MTLMARRGLLSLGTYAAQYKPVIMRVRISTVKAPSLLAKQNVRGFSFSSRQPMKVLAHKILLRITICAAERLNHSRVRKQTQ